MKETLKHKCLRTGVSLSSAKYYKKKYGLDDDSAWRHAAIRTYCKPLSFKVKCSRVGADYEKALRYRRLHMCSDEEAIQWSLHPHKSFKQMSLSIKKIKYTLHAKIYLGLLSFIFLSFIMFLLFCACVLPR